MDIDELKALYTKLDLQRAKGGDMDFENFNSELRKRLDDLETEKQNRGAAIINQLIEDIRDSDWYCIKDWGETDIVDWEKALLVAGLESLMEGKK